MTTIRDLPPEIIDKIDAMVNPKTTIHDLPEEIQKTIAREIRDLNLQGFINRQRSDEEEIRELDATIGELSFLNQLLTRNTPLWDLTPPQRNTYIRRRENINRMHENVRQIRRFMQLRGRQVVPTYMPTLTAEVRGRRGGVPFPRQKSLREILDESS